MSLQKHPAVASLTAPAAQVQNSALRKNASKAHCVLLVIKPTAQLWSHKEGTGRYFWQALCNYSSQDPMLCDRHHHTSVAEELSWTHVTALSFSTAVSGCLFHFSLKGVSSIISTFGPLNF